VRMRVKRAAIYWILVCMFFACMLSLLFPSIRPSHISAWYHRLGVSPSDLLLSWIVLLIVALLIYLKWGWLAFKTANAPTTASTSLLSDAPISGDAEDKFKRGHFADVLAQEVVLPPGNPSIVIGLEGPWGCGKSSLLRLIEARLQKMTPRPIVVRFNPWILGSVSDLADAYFRQLVEDCAAQGAAPSLVSALDGVRREIDNDRIGGIGRLVIQAWTFFSRIIMDPGVGSDLLSRKRNISSLLDQLDRPIVILVDDVDRLAPKKIQNVFQLIKAVGDFNRVGYLVAYDPAPIHSALSFKQKSGFGKDYKNKIVQVVVPFPRQPYLERKSYLRSIFRSGVDRWGLKPSVEDLRLLESALPVVVRAINTPRQAKIILNEAFLHLRLLNAEVAIADLLAFFTLNTRFPDLIAAIRRRPTIVTRRKILDEEYIASDGLPFIGESESGKEKVDPLEAVVMQVMNERTEQEQALGLLWFVFPKQSDNQTASESKRLRHENNFLLMLYGGVRGNVFANSDIKRLLYAVEDRCTLLDEHQDDETFAGFLQFAGQHVVATKEIPSLVQFLESLVKRSQALVREQSVDYSSEISRFADILLRKSANLPADKLMAARAMVLDATFLSPGHELLVRLLSGAGAWINGVWMEEFQQRSGVELDWLSDLEINRLRDDWVHLIELCPLDLLMRREPGAIGILHRWGQLAKDGYQSVQTRVVDWLSRGSDNVRMFAERFPPGISFTGTDKLITREFNLVQQFTSAEVPDRQIERLLEDCPELSERGAGSRRDGASR
jgi:hypothetical protein